MSWQKEKRWRRFCDNDSFRHKTGSDSNPANPALQRMAAGRRGCNRRALWPPSVSLGPWSWERFSRMGLFDFFRTRSKPAYAQAVSGRYDGRPLLILLENYVLSAIGCLAPEKE